ncbi:MAG: aryl-sulfate sulfotransferase [Chthoniobacterales bacterium]|nr:aryl-sulfate sulfotransferase [Chthoniobacterales bacterium]
MKKLTIIVSAVLALVISGASIAISSTVNLGSVIAGPTPFISFVTLRVATSSTLSSVSFSIKPKQGSRTRPIAASYTTGYLQRAGYYVAGSGTVTVPVFGLYQNRQNTVTVTSTFSDGTTKPTKVNITTAAFDGGTFTSPTVVQPRLRNTTLSYDFILMKASTIATTPVIIDSDSEVRWVGSAGMGGQQSLLYKNGIYVSGGTSLIRLEFDGRSKTLADYASLGVTGIHHNFDLGRDGIVMEVDTAAWVETIDMEVDANGKFLRSWNLADIVSAAMVAGGDDPSQFVYPAPVDWWHNNATSYRRSDDSFIVSSRENFVISIDYDTQAIKWILGDPTKHWYEFPSLRAFGLTLGTDTLPPIGQHATSFFDDKLLLMDDGTQSLTQMPPGDSRSYTAPRKYSIDGTTATEIYHYLIDPPIFSPFCSSVYEDAPDNYLIDYTVAGPYISTDLVGLDNTGAIAFYYKYDELQTCGTAFYADPIHLENLSFR